MHNMMWLEAVHLTGPIDEKSFHSSLMQLQQEQQTQIVKYMRKEDRDRAIIGALLPRVMVKNICGISLQDVKVARTPFGKPYLIDPFSYHYNISHAGEWVVCALSSNPVGIDIEQMKPIDPTIADRFFATKEKEWISKVDGGERLERFYELWTLKESYVKAVGRGLSIPLDSFAIHITSDDIMVLSNGIQEPWIFRQYMIHPEYKLAVCALHSNFPTHICAKPIQNFLINCVI